MQKLLERESRRPGTSRRVRSSIRTASDLYRTAWENPTPFCEADASEKLIEMNNLALLRRYMRRAGERESLGFL